MGELVTFQWLVPEAGFRWVEADDRQTKGPPRSWWLVPCDNGPDAMLCATLPLKETPALFRTFADLPVRYRPDPQPIPDGFDDPFEPARNAILAFANAHGWLGIVPPDPDGFVPVSGLWKGRLVRGERLEDWAEAILTMRLVIGLLDLADGKESEALGASLRVGKRSARLTSFDVPSDFRLDTITADSDVGAYLGGRRERAARFFAQRFINAALEQHAAPRLLYSPPWGSRSPRKVKRAPGDVMILHVYPRNLLGTLWCQAAEAAGGDREYRRCLVCRGWFKVHPEVSRSDRTLCGDRCKQKVYRDRRKARRLYAEGKRQPAIAAELGYDVAMVSDWLPERGRAGSQGRRKRSAQKRGAASSGKD